MVKRIQTMSELRSVLTHLSESQKIDEIFAKIKHVSGEWNKPHIINNLYAMLAARPKDCAFFASYTLNKPTAVFLGFVSQDFATGKRGVNEVLWFSVGQNPIGGVQVFRAIEEFIQQEKLDFLACTHMSNGGTMGLPMFYARHGFSLDSLSFVKNYSYANPVK